MSALMTYLIGLLIYVFYSSFLYNCFLEKLESQKNEFEKSITELKVGFYEESIDIRKSLLEHIELQKELKIDLIKLTNKKEK